MAERDKRRGLGRGLSALMADVTETQSVAEQGAAEHFIPIEKISPNPEQPRKRFDPEDLQDLANSIREKGVIQPLIVRGVRTVLLKSSRGSVAGARRRWLSCTNCRLSSGSLPTLKSLKWRLSRHPTCGSELYRRGCGLSTAYGQVRAYPRKDG